MPSVCEDEISLLSRKLQQKTCAQGSPASPGTTRTRSNRFSTWSWWADTTTAATHVVLTRYTANEGQVIIQYKCLVPIYIFPEMKLCSLVISKTEL
jgi:hypothetical protein